jgi:hypothetical protein
MPIPTRDEITAAQSRRGPVKAWTPCRPPFALSFLLPSRSSCPPSRPSCLSCCRPFRLGRVFFITGLFALPSPTQLVALHQMSTNVRYAALRLSSRSISSSSFSTTVASCLSSCRPSAFRRHAQGLRHTRLRRHVRGKGRMAAPPHAERDVPAKGRNKHTQKKPSQWRV